MSYELNEWKQIQKIAEELKRIADAQVLAANASVRQAIAQEKISDTLVFINIGILSVFPTPTGFKVNERSLDRPSPKSTSNLKGENYYGTKIEGRNRLADS